MRRGTRNALTALVLAVGVAAGGGGWVVTVDGAYKEGLAKGQARAEARHAEADAYLWDDLGGARWCRTMYDRFGGWDNWGDGR